MVTFPFVFIIINVIVFKLIVTKLLNILQKYVLYHNIYIINVCIICNTNL